MRRILLLASLVLLLTVPTAARAQDAPAQAIEKVLHDQQAAWNAGDIETFMHGYQDSPETTFIGKTIASGYQGILERYRKTYANHDAMGKLDFSELKVRMLGENHAVVTGRFHLTRTQAGGGDASGVYSLVFEKGSKGWQIILDHTSAD
ncbi:YybH family protein [Silvibacterium acidisoli]|uniref:YybH family protein n=1 Tax=Acidobacteriaceae bacterium ZG23-2 TaxID=2883246 RepID=UPI00406C9364